MKFIYIYFLAFGMFFCDCIYEGSYSKVIWDTEKNIYVQKNINLGEQSISADFTFCNKKGKVLKLKGKVNNQDTFIGNNEIINTEIVIMRCDKNGNVKETITTTRNDGLFDFETVRDKKGYLVFKEKGKDEGVRYNIKSFK